MKKVLLKDIVIPAGTVFETAPVQTTRSSEGHYEAIIGLSKDTTGSFVYYAGEEGSEEYEQVKEYFTDLK